MTGRTRWMSDECLFGLLEKAGQWCSHLMRVTTTGLSTSIFCQEVSG